MSANTPSDLKTVAVAPLIRKRRLSNENPTNAPVQGTASSTSALNPQVSTTAPSPMNHSQASTENKTPRVQIKLTSKLSSTAASTSPVGARPDTSNVGAAAPQTPDHNVQPIIPSSSASDNKANVRVLLGPLLDEAIAAVGYTPKEGGSRRDYILDSANHINHLKENISTLESRASATESKLRLSEEKVVSLRREVGNANMRDAESSSEARSLSNQLVLSSRKLAEEKRSNARAIQERVAVWTDNQSLNADNREHLAKIAGLEKQVKTLQKELTESTQLRLEGVDRIDTLENLLRDSQALPRALQCIQYCFAYLVMILSFFPKFGRSCYEHLLPHLPTIKAYARSWFHSSISAIQSLPGMIGFCISMIVWAAPPTFWFIWSWLLKPLCVAILRLLIGLWSQAKTCVVQWFWTFCHRVQITWAAVVAWPSTNRWKIWTAGLTILLFMVPTALNLLSCGPFMTHQATTYFMHPHTSTPVLLPTWTDSREQVILDFAKSCPAFGHVYGTVRDCFIEYDERRLVVGMSHTSMLPIIEEHKKHEARLEKKLAKRPANKSSQRSDVPENRWLRPLGVSVGIFVVGMAVRAMM
ncbi:uncharacterized protein LY89DRAFT_767054 [Mollisia scopiformis]|uniref:Uncharacterized protein n=1 Tax=Mollisia scopiformis TaxID=149040 RepID=A0A132B4N2_MOLSC|nr:uncharacterized protein LY89DRAFT_767054 [Mollisia scopiformis]KUJ07203.1 hypothetical protein LY89DRAFT_767054 [Mollisia scopiformis]